MDAKTLASYIDATIVRNNNTFEEADRLADAAVKYGFSSVITLPCYTEYMVSELSGTGVRVGSVAGFPWGGELSDAKAFEAARLMALGADEVDIVINLGYFFSERYNLVENDIRQVRDVIPEGKILKCIVESCMLSDEQIKTVTKIVIDGGADFIKTCTGFHGAAEVRHVEIMAETAKGAIKIKASGGIRTAEDAVRFIDAGASRLGIGFDSAVKIIDSVK